MMTKRERHEPPVRLLQPNTTTKAPANSKSHPTNPITVFPLITGWGSASTSCHLQRLGGSNRRRRVHESFYSVHFSMLWHGSPHFWISWNMASMVGSFVVMTVPFFNDSLTSKWCDWKTRVT